MEIVRHVPDESERVAADGFKACNHREKRLCELYVENIGKMSPQEIAREAGYVSGSLAPLKKPHVAAYLKLLQDRLSQQSMVTAEKVLKELATVAFSNILDFMEVDEEGIPHFDFRKATREQWAAVAEFMEDATGGSNDGERRLVLRRRLKMSPKNQALELLAKHYKLLTEKHEIGFTDEVIAKLNEGRARVKTLEHQP